MFYWVGVWFFFQINLFIYDGFFGLAFIHDLHFIFYLRFPFFIFLFTIFLFYFLIYSFPCFYLALFTAGHQIDKRWRRAVKVSFEPEYCRHISYSWKCRSFPFRQKGFGIFRVDIRGKKEEGKCMLSSK